MEAVATQSNEVFQPVTVEMILETQEELDALAVFCNYTPMTDAAKALGVDIRPIYDVLIKSGYDVTKWYSQVGPATQALLDHPALRGKVKEGSTKSVKKETESVPNYILDQLLKEFAPFLESVITDMDDDEQEETIAGPLTCRVIYTETLSGDGKIGLSDGREYLYEIAGCGEAVHVKQLNGKYLTEIPTSEEETYELGEAELSLLEVVLSKIS